MPVTDLLECSLCNNQYDERKNRSRILTCGHYFCHDCLDQIIRSATPRCPTCRKHISAQSAEMLVPNFLMDDLISKMKSGNGTFDLEGNDEDFSAGSCPKHKKCQLYFTCKSHKLKVCRDCTVIEHPPSKCQIISFEDDLENTKKMTIRKLKFHKLNRETDINDLQGIITDAESKIKEQKEEIAKLQRTVCENEQVVKNANEAIQDCMGNKSKIEKILQELISSMTIDKIILSCQEAECIINASNLIGISLEKYLDVFRNLQSLIDKIPHEFTKKIFHGGAIVHTSIKVNGEKRFAQLMVKNGDIHLPALASSTMPPDPMNTVTVSSLLTLYPSTNADFYMTLAAEGKDLGTVYVKLNDTAYAKYARKLCMGTIGPSYRGIIFKVKGNSICTGSVISLSEEYHPPRLPKQVAVQKGTLNIIGNNGLQIWA